MAGACPPGVAGLEGDLMESDVVVGPSTRNDSINGERTIRIASWLFLINGIAWGLGSIPNAIYRSQLGRMPKIGELETMGGPVSSQFGWEGVVWFLIPMGLLAWVEVLAGWWLRPRCRDNHIGADLLQIALVGRMKRGAEAEAWNGS